MFDSPKFDRSKQSVTAYDLSISLSLLSTSDFTFSYSFVCKTPERLHLYPAVSISTSLRLFGTSAHLEHDEILQSLRALLVGLVHPRMDV